MNRIKISFYLAKHINALIDERAKLLGITKTEVIRRAIEEYLKDRG